MFIQDEKFYVVIKRGKKKFFFVPLKWVKTKRKVKQQALNFLGQEEGNGMVDSTATSRLAKKEEKKKKRGDRRGVRKYERTNERMRGDSEKNDQRI